MRVNVKPSRLSNRPVLEPAATVAFEPPWELERLISCSLLGEQTFYVAGKDIEERIRELAHTEEPSHVARLAVHARSELGLRHTPLLLLVCLANRTGNSALIRKAARSILRTPRDAMDLLAIYWEGGDRRTSKTNKSLPWSFKRALQDGFNRWSDYQIRRYGTLESGQVKLRDLLSMCHVKPPNPELFAELRAGTISAPETWEATIPRLHGSERKDAWERLLNERKLGALAVCRNLANFTKDGVSPAVVSAALQTVKADDVWPWQALAAYRAAPQFAADLTALMVRSAGSMPRINGLTGVLIDVSGSMDAPLAGKSQMMRFDAAAGLAVVLKEICEHSIIATFSNQFVYVLTEDHGCELANHIVRSQPHGGTALGPAVNRMLSDNPGLDRLVVVTDEQAQAGVTVGGKSVQSFIINVAPYQRGVEWENGEVTRINGWSSGVVRYLAASVENHSRSLRGV